MPNREITQERIRTNGNYRRWNAHELVSDRTRYVNRSPARYALEHEMELKDDPDRLTCAFILDTVFSIKPKK